MPVQSISRGYTFVSIAPIRALADQCLAAIGELRARRAIRRALGTLSDDQLRDAGLIRSDLDAACEQPLSLSCALRLKAAARGKSGNW